MKGNGMSPTMYLILIYMYMHVQPIHKEVSKSA